LQSNTAIAAVLANVEQLQVAGAGHFVHIEQPEQVAEGLASFLRRVAFAQGRWITSEPNASG